MVENIQILVKDINEKKLIGMHEQMSLVNDSTYNLFHNFMPRRNEITNRTSQYVYDIRIYSNKYYQNFSPANLFTKWAAAEVTDHNTIPENMESIILPKGKYILIQFLGAKNAGRIYEYIFKKWLPDANYLLDSRPHFDILDESSKNDDSNILQNIWIPIKSES